MCAANMDQMMFASKAKNPWWAKDDENYVFPDATNRELFSASKADFLVSLHPIFDRNADEIPGHFHLVNDANGATLRVCKGRFVPNQSEDIFNILETLSLDLESCGAVGDGQKVFFNLMDEGYTVGEGNTIETRIVCGLPHDGSMKLSLGQSSFRVECSNTWTMWAKTLNADEVFSTKQTANAQGKLSAWTKAFTEMRETNKTLQEKFRLLARSKFTAESQAEIIGKLYGGKKSTRTKNTMEKLAQIIGDNASNVPMKQRGTAWDMWNGLTYMTTHEPALRKNTDPLESSLFGTTQKFLEKGFALLCNSVPDSVIEENAGNRVLSL